MHEGYLFNISHYYSYVLYFNTGIWWYFNDDKVTKIKDFQKGYILEIIGIKIYERTTQGSKNVLLVIYIRKKYLEHPALFLVN